MSNIIKKKPRKEAASYRQFVTLFMNGQMFGIDVTEVRDILLPQQLSHIPLSPVEVSGSLNLRGRIVTAINLHVILGMETPEQKNKGLMNVVVSVRGELYSLQVESVGEVLTLSTAEMRGNPENIDPVWRVASEGIYQLDSRLLVILDADKLLTDRMGERDVA